MKKSVKNIIKDILRDFPLIDDYVEERKLELRYPTRELDENVGGGKSGAISKPQETTLITIEQDKRLKRLLEQKRVIESCYLNADLDTQTIIDELYFKKHPEYNMNGLILNSKIFCNLASAYRKENSFIEEVAKELDINVPSE